jgi:Phage major capsid protein E
MPMVNPFAGAGYSLAALTVAINKLPNMYTLLGDMGLFSEEGTTLRTVIIEQRNNVLNLLPTRPVGSPGTQGTIGKRQIRSFVIPHIPHDDVILPSEVQGVRAFGSETEADSVANLMALKLQTMKNKHEITKEWLRVGALNGIVYDADGTTVLYNYFNEFGIAQEVINFPLSVAANEVVPMVNSVKRWIETHLFGETSTSIMFLCSPEWFDAFTTQATVKDAYKYYQQLQNLSGDFRKGFTHAGCMFQEYIGQATDIAGNVHRFIAANEAVAFPMGTTQTFKLYDAPADFNETANTVGLPLYAKQEERPFERGWDLHTQSNPLPICTRPEVLVRITKT